jgi:hypothetical protein
MKINLTWLYQPAFFSAIAAICSAFAANQIYTFDIASSIPQIDVVAHIDGRPQDKHRQLFMYVQNNGTAAANYVNAICIGKYFGDEEWPLVTEKEYGPNSFVARRITSNSGEISIYSDKCYFKRETQNGLSALAVLVSYESPSGKKQTEAFAFIQKRTLVPSLVSDQKYSISYYIPSWTQLIQTHFSGNNAEKDLKFIECHYDPHKNQFG